MANLNVTYGDMRDAASRLQSGKDDLIGKLTELQTLVNNLVSGGYVTDASSGAFNESYNQFTTGTKTAVEGLDGLSQYLTKAAEALQTTDQELANALKG
jgi:WXG100 family type VII secretion target